MQSANQPGAALDSLRTVEFRQTLRGYHIDDVDEYLERVAVEVESLQEQLRQAGERMRQATDRIAQLEQQPRAAQQPAPGATEESLQRTLMLAQKFVDQTQADAEAQARSLLDEAQQKARTLLSDAEEQARTLAEESEGRVREEVTRLETLRTKLAGDVEAITKHLDTERTRLRAVLGEMLHWIDENVQPSATLSVEARDEGRSTEVRQVRDVPMSASPQPGLVPVGPPNTPNGTPH
jgi:cell division initiation protein